MRAEGCALQICHDADALYALYICDPNYGSLLYGGSQLWNLLQLRYLLCVLFEYCATLGMIDVAYRTPHDARADFVDLWGIDDMTFLSRYDGLMYFRLTALGAYCLGVSGSYTPVEHAATCSLTVQANLQVRVSGGTLSAEDLLMLDNWAIKESAQDCGSTARRRSLPSSEATTPRNWHRSCKRATASRCRCKWRVSCAPAAREASR